MSKKNGKRFNPQQNSTTPQTGKDTLTPQEKHQQWVNSKLEKARQDDYNTVSQKTKDSVATVNFINIIDNLMYYVRMNAGTNSRIPAESLQSYIDRVNEAKETLNRIAAEMCRDMGRTYRPPRGFKNPLTSGKIAPAVKGPYSKSPKKAAEKTKEPAAELPKEAVAVEPDAAKVA